jgi:hypothetical protein
MIAGGTRWEQRKALDQAEHILFDSSFHGHRFPAFEFKSSFATLSRSTFKFETYFLVQFCNGFLLLLYLLSYCLSALGEL